MISTERREIVRLGLILIRNPIAQTPDARRPIYPALTFGTGKYLYFLFREKAAFTLPSHLPPFLDPLHFRASTPVKINYDCERERKFSAHSFLLGCLVLISTNGIVGYVEGMITSGRIGILSSFYHKCVRRPSDNVDLRN